MNWTLLLILITGFVIAAIITYLAESWRYKKFGFSLGSKSHSMWLFTGSLFITLALAALFISYYDLRGNKDTPASLHVERPSAKSPVKKDAPASFRVEHPSAKSSMKKRLYRSCDRHLEYPPLCRTPFRLGHLKILRILTSGVRRLSSCAAWMSLLERLKSVIQSGIACL